MPGGLGRHPPGVELAGSLGVAGSPIAITCPYPRPLSSMASRQKQLLREVEGPLGTSASALPLASAPATQLRVSSECVRSAKRGVTKDGVRGALAGGRACSCMNSLNPDVVRKGREGGYYYSTRFRAGETRAQKG